MFWSFRHYNYRIWFVGYFVSSVGQWMQSTAQAWIVLTALTANDAFAMSLTVALQLVPQVVLVGLSGWAADHFDRRTLFAITQSVSGLLAVGIGVLLLTDQLTLPLMLVFAAVLGMTTAFDVPARHAFVTDLVPRADAANAVALNSASFNSARIIGPTMAGLMIVGVGPAWAFLANAGTFLVMIVVLMLLRRSEFYSQPILTGSRSLLAGFRYLRERIDLVVVFLIVFLTGAFAQNFQIYFLTMTLELGRDADGFGIVSGAFAVGSVVGALTAAARRQARISVAILGVFLFALFAGVAALAPEFWAFAVASLLMGFALLMTLATTNGYVQTTVEPNVRGRVIALYIATLIGGMPVGAPLIGWVAEDLGARASIVTVALGCLLAAVVGTVWYVWFRRDLGPGL